MLLKNGDDYLKHFKQNDNNLAIAYYCYSSAGQKEASIDQQREQALKDAEKREFTIIKEYQDKAISGTTDERPDFQLMLSEVNKKRPAVLIRGCLRDTCLTARDQFKKHLDYFRIPYEN